MDSFITRDGKKLRRGYTTGSCASAAAKAAALMLFGGKKIEQVYLLTPAGIGLTLAVNDIEIAKDYVSCGIIKDSGDDPDITNGIMVYARVSKSENAGKITIDGGVGVGRVTKPGLNQPVGNAAINSVPRQMIIKELGEVCEDYGYDGGLDVLITIPQGVELAKKTFNPRLGITGGISVLGTTGIVEPMSDDAVIETIRTELSMRVAKAQEYVLFTPGNYGSDYIKNELGLSAESAVMTSNYIGDAFFAAGEIGFQGALLVGHIGKIIKLAGGMFNTHSRWGDCRAEIIASHAAVCGASTDTVSKIMDSAMSDDMLDLCGELRPSVVKSIMERIEFHMSAKHFGCSNIAVITFSNKYGLLGATKGADELIKKLREQG